jgi:MSHA biogenesis protein MshJ
MTTATSPGAAASNLQPRLTALWRRAARAFDARAPRERVLLIASAAVLLLGLANLLWLEDGWRAWQGLSQQRQGLEVGLQRLQADQAALVGRHAADVERMKAEVAALEARLAQPVDGSRQELVPAEQMPQLLGELIGRRHGLRIRALQSLGQTPVGAAEAGKAGAAATASTLHRHGVEVKVEGSYPELLAYLQALEALPQKLLWGSLQLQVEQHPRAVLTLRVYTLSPQAGWVQL